MVPVHVHFKKLIDIVDNKFFKKLEYSTDKKSSDKKAQDIEEKIYNVSWLVTNAAFGRKIKNIKDKILYVSGLVVNVAFAEKLKKINMIFLMLVD